MADPPEPQLPELRASDVDREQAVDTLRHAASAGQLTVDELEERISSAYAARTRKELEGLTADLSPVPAHQSGLRVGAGPGGDRRVISVMSGHDRTGRWRVAPRFTVVNVMGGTEIDFNDAELSDPVTEINVYSFWGGGEMWVPHGVNVQVSNIALMGGNEVELGDEAAPPGAPTLHIRLVSIMAGFALKRGRKLTREERKQQKELRKAEKAAKRELEP